VELVSVEALETLPPQRRVRGEQVEDLVSVARELVGEPLEVDAPAVQERLREAAAGEPGALQVGHQELEVVPARLARALADPAGARDGGARGRRQAVGRAVVPGEEQGAARRLVQQLALTAAVLGLGAPAAGLPQAEPAQGGAEPALGEGGELLTVLAAAQRDAASLSCFMADRNGMTRESPASAAHSLVGLIDIMMLDVYVLMHAYDDQHR
jgi:hypothetical protein